MRKSASLEETCSSAPDNKTGRTWSSSRALEHHLHQKKVRVILSKYSHLTFLLQVEPSSFPDEVVQLFTVNVKAKKIIN